MAWSSWLGFMLAETVSYILAIFNLQPQLLDGHRTQEEEPVEGFMEITDRVRVDTMIVQRDDTGQHHAVLPPVVAS